MPHYSAYFSSIFIPSILTLVANKIINVQRCDNHVKCKTCDIYYSSNGTNYQLAQWASEGALEVDADIKVLKIPETLPQSIIEKIQLGSPT
ncbi:hypothetical protein Back11_43490 [Paenibacillus baekrokdamisoli]|uniref:Uncharacterized protein n=1 Tax=Paenibacillus baekrokdamisoli TaxID=1712516 RepID=A0A3G9JJ51_9BACL|nr:hypothetical protein Back11_43490 [Paenibacillus baekrokdamisoli]